MEKDFQMYRDKFNSLIKEKTNTDNLTIKQEERLKTYEEEIDILKKECKSKDQKFKKLDEVYLSVIKVIEEHKKTIQYLKNKIRAKDVEENNKKIILFQKEQEISLLRSFINSYKSDFKIRFKNRLMNTNNENYFFQKDFPKLKTNRSDLELISKKRLGQKLNKNNYNTTKNKNLPNINNNINNKQNENDINENNNNFKEKIRNDMDDQDEENIKDISNLMKKMIND